jgi:hypothetical protein
MLNCLVLGEKAAMTVVMGSKQRMTNLEIWHTPIVSSVARVFGEGPRPGDMGVIQNLRSMLRAHFRKASPPVGMQDELYAQDDWAVLLLLQ